MSSILPDKYTINLVDIAGRTVWSEVKTESGTGEASWNFSGLNVPSGIYQLTYIPLGHKHRLRNVGKTMLEMIEVQSGSYLGEDDIVRFEDVYGRS